MNEATGQAGRVLRVEGQAARTLGRVLEVVGWIALVATAIAAVMNIAIHHGTDTYFSGNRFSSDLEEATTVVFPLLLVGGGRALRAFGTYIAIVGGAEPHDTAGGFELAEPASTEDPTDDE